MDFNNNKFPTSRRLVVLTLVNKETKIPHKDVAPLYRMIWVGNNHSEAALMITLREAAEASLSASVKAEHYVKADIQESLTDPQNIVPTQVAYEFYSERLATNE